MTQLTASDLALRHGTRDILRGVGVTASGGEFIVLIGPNGSGKSTLLSLLAGLGRPDAGEVQLDGVPLERIPPRQLALQRAWLPQAARCEWPLAVEHMVALGLSPLGREDPARVQAVLADCDLLALRQQSVATLSGGELARAMLARALVADPAVLIVDEPLAGLDPRHAWEAARRLRQLAVEQGKLVIATIHDLNIAMRRATRVWALHDGRLLADGPPEASMTGEMLQQLFGVPVAVTRRERHLYVDFAPEF
ncbi:MAG: ABC transporter ATP-binding protein [Steroidobacteraceae bacterium]